MKRYLKSNKKQNDVKKIVKSFKDVIHKELQVYDFNVTMQKLCMIFSSYYMQYKIRMISDGENYLKNKFVQGGDFYNNGDIELFLSDDIINNLHMINDMNSKFNKELVNVLQKITNQRDRILKVKDEFDFIGYNPIKKYVIDNLQTFAEIAKDELEQDNFSFTRSLIYDLIGNRAIYSEFKDMMQD